MSVEYVRVCQGVNDFGKLVPADDPGHHYGNLHSEKDYYKSIFFYNKDHYRQFEETHSVKGITDVVTNRLAWDFDSENNVELARADAVALCTKLMGMQITADQIGIYFSGNKGFAIELKTTSRFTPEEFRNINLKLAEGLKTNDPKIFNASRIFRLPQTKHPESGLYKIPLSLEELTDSSVSDIKAKAKERTEDETGQPPEIDLPEVIYSLRIGSPETNPIPVSKVIDDLNFKDKPKGFSNCKYAIMNGYFDEGNRNHCLTILVAACKAIGFPKDIAYGIGKGAIHMQAVRSGKKKFSKTELMQSVKSVYSVGWKGGQYTCRTDETLKSICESLGVNRCRHEESQFLSTGDVYGIFRNYANSIESNTIRTGIESLDEAVTITTSQMVGILGAPASGKTSLALNILNNTSHKGVPSLFLSLDMAAPILYQKMIHKVTGMNKDQIFEAFKEGGMDADHLNARLGFEFKNVKFSFRSGWDVEHIREAIVDYTAKSQIKPKLLMIDYAECLTGPYSDATANSGFNANALKDLTNDLDICTILLVQPPKRVGDAGYPLLSMRDVKGSSMLEQAFSILLGIYREGFSPKHVKDDLYLTINCLKNRMGQLYSEDYAWNGLKGEISEISDEQREDLARLRTVRDKERAGGFSGSNEADRMGSSLTGGF